MIKRSLILFLFLSIFCGFASAYLAEDVLLEGSYGSGANTAYLVVDFWPYNGQDDSFAFEAKFDGTISGIELLDVVADNESSFSYSQTGGFMGYISYITQGTEYYNDYVWNETDQRYWSYWISSDFGENWGYSGSGAAETDVVEGSTNGWLAIPGDDYSSTPTTPVPEPVAFTVFGLGALFVFKKKRK